MWPENGLKYINTIVSEEIFKILSPGWSSPFHVFLHITNCQAFLSPNCLDFLSEIDQFHLLPLIDICITAVQKEKQRAVFNLKPFLYSNIQCSWKRSHKYCKSGNLRWWLNTRFLWSNMFIRGLMIHYSKGFLYQTRGCILRGFKLSAQLVKITSTRK